MSRGPDAAALLERALIRAGRSAGVEVTIAAADWTRWASATFTGARHRLTLRASHSTALERWLAELPEHDFALPGHVVADLLVAGSRRSDTTVTIDIEALTVEVR